MEKTKLGISVGVLAAAIYFIGLFNGYLIPVLITGYVLLREDDAWLKKAAVKAIATMAVFSLLSVLIGLLPDFISFINSIVSVFGGHFQVTLVTKVVSVLVLALDLVRTLLLIILGFQALSKHTFPVPVVDKLVEKYM